MRYLRVCAGLLGHADVILQFDAVFDRLRALWTHEVPLGPSARPIGTEDEISPEWLLWKFLHVNFRNAVLSKQAPTVGSTGAFYAYGGFKPAFTKYTKRFHETLAGTLGVADDALVRPAGRVQFLRVPVTHVANTCCPKCVNLFRTTRSGSRADRSAPTSRPRCASTRAFRRQRAEERLQRRRASAKGVRRCSKGDFHLGCMPGYAVAGKHG